MIQRNWQELIKPNKLNIEPGADVSRGATVVAEPLERGFGLTLGNALRRVLLSSLQGAAVTAIHIDGVLHEFSSIPGVREDVTDIILNIKSIIISMESETPKTLTVTKKGPGVVTAGDLTGDASITIHNKNQVIATLTNEHEFNLELEIRKGRGFVTALENTQEEQIIGVIPIDSVYSPVTRVRYKTEDTRVGQKTNYDRLIIEIWTNGTVTPEMALVEAAKILRKHLNAFVQYFEPGENLDAELPERSEVATPAMNEELTAKLNQPISTLDLSVRASNCLESAKIHTVGDLTKMTETDLLKVRSFGKTSLREVKRKLQDIGLSLGMVVGAPAADAATA